MVLVNPFRNPVISAAPDGFEAYNKSLVTCLPCRQRLANAVTNPSQGSALVAESLQSVACINVM